MSNAAAAAGESSSAQDAELFRRAQSGDRGAFAQIVQIYQDRIYNAVLRMVGDHEEARDLAQETFTRALVKIDSFRGEAQPYTWLFRIALNLAISQLRKTHRRRTFTIGTGDSSGSNGRANSGRAGSTSDDQAAGLLDRVAQDRGIDPSEQVENLERNEQVVAALGRLDAEYRAILVMRDVEGFDYQQMADVLNLPLGTLKSRLFRARIALRDELRPYMEGQRKK
ncbi:MAG: sigma-70 family RNA polymerase sigma factor [Anaerolineae bacterium]|nr:sigma-70 family RNA polymerase sigma factor [Phycisphaerae bacterium]